MARWGLVILVVLLVGVVAGQVAYVRSIGELKGTGLAVAIRVVNIALVLVAMGLAAWTAYSLIAAGGR